MGHDDEEDSSAQLHNYMSLASGQLANCNFTIFALLKEGFCILVQRLIESTCMFRALHWVTVEMLGAPLKEEIPAVSDSLDKAITGKVFVAEALWKNNQ